MKKCIFSLFVTFFVFVLTGCSVNYNLNIDDLFTETIELNTNYVGLNVNKVLASVRESYGKYYDIELAYDIADCGEACLTKMPVGFSTIKSYSYNKYPTSQIVKDYFGNIALTKTGDVYKLVLTPKVQFESIFHDTLYMNSIVDKVNVGIFTNYEVVSHNADVVANGYYNWNYTKENCDREIEISYKISSDNNDDITNNDFENNFNGTDDHVENKNDNNNIKLIFVSLFGVLGFLLLVYFIRNMILQNKI